MSNCMGERGEVKFVFWKKKHQLQGTPLPSVTDFDKFHIHTDIPPPSSFYYSPPLQLTIREYFCFLLLCSTFRDYIRFSFVDQLKENSIY